MCFIVCLVSNLSFNCFDTDEFCAKAHDDVLISTIDL